MNQPVLSIGIPTFNRENYIFNQVKLLTNLINKNKLQKEVEIVVSDNNSDYEIFSLLKEFNNNFFLKIHKNKKNIGMGRNIFNTFQISKGKFFFFIGDDDTISEEGLLALVNACKKKNNSLIVMRGDLSFGWEKYFPKKIDSESWQEYNNINDCDIYYMANANTAVLKSAVDSSRISCQNNICEHPIIHAILFLSALKNRDSICFINTPILSNSINNSVGSSYSYLLSQIYLQITYEKFFEKSHNIELDPKKFYKRHPLLSPKLYMRHVLFFAYIFNLNDTNNERVKTLLFLNSSESELLSNVLKFLLKAATVKEIFLVLRISLKFISIFNSRAKTLEMMSKNLNLERRRKLKDKNNHYWGLGIGK